MLREFRGAMFLLIEWEYEIITIFAKYFAQNNIPTEKLTLTPLKTFLERLRNFHHLAARCWSREYFFPGIIYQHPGAVLILSALIDSNCYAIFFFSLAECHFGKELKELGSTWFPDLGAPFGKMYCIKCECVPVSIRRNAPALFPVVSGAKPSFSSPCHFYGCRIMLKANICTLRHFKLNQEI